MHLMQYGITLPADYDMGIIRHRVATKGRALDGFAGLALKAYAVQERGKDGSPVNQYAPFYFWDDPLAMTGFLRGPGFRGLSSDFGRPVVRNWHGIALQEGPARDALPRAAERRTWTVPAGADVGDCVERAVQDLRVVARQPGVHTAALGLDPHGWELARFVLREQAVSGTERDAETDADADADAGADAGADGDRYEVLYLGEGAAR